MSSSIYSVISDIKKCDVLIYDSTTYSKKIDIEYKYLILFSNDNVDKNTTPSSITLPRYVTSEEFINAVSEAVQFITRQENPTWVN